MAALLPASSLEHLPIVVEDLWSGRGTHVLFCDGGDATLPASHDAGPLRFRERRNLVEFELEHLEMRSEEHTSELQSRLHLVCRLLLEKKKKPVAAAPDGERSLTACHPDSPAALPLSTTSCPHSSRSALPLLCLYRLIFF